MSEDKIREELEQLKAEMAKKREVVTTLLYLSESMLKSLADKWPEKEYYAWEKAVNAARREFTL